MPEVHPIRLSAVGYFPERAKLATVTAPGDGTFEVRAAGGGAWVWSSTLTGPVADPITQAPLWLADFTEFCSQGSFYLEVEGVGTSTTFVVAPDVYNQPYVMAMQGLTGQRCGTAVELSGGDTTWQHALCHTRDASLYYLTGAQTINPSTGGWHDAGDYGKYASNGAFSVGMLLAAWEQFQPALEATPLPSVPEHGGPIPDFLAEVKWELDWLLTTQGADGSVSHKVTAQAFEAFIMPEDDRSTRYYTGVSTMATGDFVAVMAAAARIYQPYDADFAARALVAAQAGYAYLQAHPEVEFPDLSAFSTGMYKDSHDSDERLWAATELWETTGDPAVLADVEAQNAEATVDDSFDWANVKNLGLFTYLLSARDGRDPDRVAALTASLIQSADNIVALTQSHPYGRAVAGYSWGSNGTVARTAMNLTVANRLSPDPRYLDAITAQVDHLFGRNNYDRSQVTGLGYNPPLHPHHRPSASDGVVAPWPGLLVGGQQSAKTYDWQDSQSMPSENEVAINWNAPLVYALAGFLQP
jgi:endoglucanase